MKTQNKILNNKKGLVMIVVLSTVALLLILVQEIVFDTGVELKNGVASYRRLKAYHAAKSGVQLSILKIMTYKQVSQMVKKLAPILENQARPYLDLLWKNQTAFPPVLSDELTDTVKSEIQGKIDRSLFKDQSYATIIEAEESKLNLNGLYSPVSSVRDWTHQTLLLLLTRLRDKYEWLANNYSTADLQKFAELIRDSFEPSLLSESPHRAKQEFVNPLDLQSIDEFPKELIEFVQPYLATYGGIGININFADPLLLKSLHEDITDKMVEDMVEKLEEQPLSSMKDCKSFFQDLGMGFIEESYFQKGDRSPELAELIFNFDAPQNFKIISYGQSGSLSHGIEAILLDPGPTFNRIFRLFEKERKEKDTQELLSSSKSTAAPVKYQATPFLIQWKDIN